MTAVSRMGDGDQGLGSPGPPPTRWSGGSRADNSPRERPDDRSMWSERHHGAVPSRFARESPENPVLARLQSDPGGAIGGNAFGSRASAARARPESSSMRRTRSSTDANVIS